MPTNTPIWHTEYQMSYWSEKSNLNLAGNEQNLDLQWWYSMLHFETHEVHLPLHFKPMKQSVKWPNNKIHNIFFPFLHKTSHEIP